MTLSKKGRKPSKVWLRNYIAEAKMVILNFGMNGIVPDEIRQKLKSDEFGR